MVLLPGDISVSYVGGLEKNDWRNVSNWGDSPATVIHPGKFII